MVYMASITVECVQKHSRILDRFNTYKKPIVGESIEWYCPTCMVDDISMKILKVENLKER